MELKIGTRRNKEKLTAKYIADFLGNSVAFGSRAFGTVVPQRVIGCGLGVCRVIRSKNACHAITMIKFWNPQPAQTHLSQESLASSLSLFAPKAAGIGGVIIRSSSASASGREDATVAAEEWGGASSMETSASRSRGSNASETNHIGFFMRQQDTHNKYY